MTLVEFLLARVAEDEEGATAAGAGKWSWSHGYGEMCNDRECPYGQLMAEDPDGKLKLMMDVHGFDVHDDWEGGPHIIRHDPVRVLAECQARRAIIESFRRVDVEARSRGVLGMDRPEGEDLGVLAVAAALQGVVRVLAQPFKGHPDFDSAWSLD